MKSEPPPIRTRFAPSPTGPLHKGHALSALWSRRRATALGGEFLVRIEDIDFTRARPELIWDITQVLEWLELDVRDEIVNQSDRTKLYQNALNELHKLGVIYPCTCTRKEILAITQDPSAPYPGTCRGQHANIGDPAAWRLDWQSLCKDKQLSNLTWRDLRAGIQNAGMQAWGDVVIARRDIGTSYHLAHVIDDAAQGITHVTRGMDLFDQTPIHRVLQSLLRLPEPSYDHHPLVMKADDPSAKLSKREHATSLMQLVSQGLRLPQLLAELEPILALVDNASGNVVLNSLDENRE